MFVVTLSGNDGGLVLSHLFSREHHMISSRKTSTTMLRLCAREQARRFLSNSRLYQGEKSVIPQIVLDELRRVNNLAKPKEENATKNSAKKQIFLDPSKVQDKRFNRIVSDLQNTSSYRNVSLENPLLDEDLFTNEALKEIQDDMEPKAHQTIAQRVEKFKPAKLEVSHYKFQQMQSEISRAFKKHQLGEYLESKYRLTEFSPMKKSTAHPPKRTLVERILCDIWKVKRSSSVSSVDDLLDSKQLKMRKSDLFLLLLESGYIIKYLSRTGVRIKFDPKKDQIRFVGTSTQVNNAEIILTSILNRAHREMLNMSNIKSLFLHKNAEFLLEKLIKNTEVFFAPLPNDDYELIALNKSQIKKCKRLLMWQLNRNDHLQESLLVPQHKTATQLLMYEDDDALPWDMRDKDLYVMQPTEVKHGLNQQLETDLAKFSNETLAQLTLDFEDDVFEAKQLPQDVGNDFTSSSWDLLDDMGLFGSKLGESAEKRESTESIEASHQNGSIENPSVIETNLSVDSTLSNSLNDSSKDSSLSFSPLSSDQVDAMYKKLMDFSYRKLLNGIVEAGWNAPITTITLGNVLFEGDGKAPAVGEDTPYTFTTKVPLANDKVLGMNVYEYPEMKVKQINHLLNNDPHNYAIQMKFVPTAFSPMADFAELDDTMKYPPVEIWVDLNDRRVADLDTLQVVTVEAENHCYVALADSADLRVTSQVSGDLLKDVDQAVPDAEDNVLMDIDDLLSSPTLRYRRFDHQPGLRQFLNNAKLDFSGKHEVVVPPTVSLNIGGKTVEYQYLNTTHRRQLNFNYPTAANDGDRLVQFNIVEGGSLGGHTIEINFVGNLDGIVTKDEFERLLHDALHFVHEL